jgi:hypothetical protein
MSLPVEHRWLLSPRAGLNWGLWPAFESASDQQPVPLPAQVNQAFQTWVKDLKAASEAHSLQATLIEIPQTVTPIFVPTRVWELAHNQDQVKTQVLTRDSKPEFQVLKILVSEKMTEPVSDPQEWEAWMKQRHYGTNQDGRIACIPAPSAKIDRLQATHYHYLMADMLSLWDKIWLRVSLKYDPLLPDVLHVGSFDGQIGVGLAKEFYQQTLPGIARALGYKFITGQNDINNVGFFTAVAGRVTLGDIQTRYRKQFFRIFDEEVLDTNTVQFLDPSDKAKFTW